MKACHHSIRWNVGETTETTYLKTWLTRMRCHEGSRSMKTQSIEYQDGNVTLRGFVAFDDETSHQRPGVLVMPEAFGLGTHATQRAERLASLGYVALAGDPYGNGLEVTDLQEAIKRASALREDPAKFRQRARVALDTLASLPQVDASRLAAIGYCLGGHLRPRAGTGRCSVAGRGLLS